jgi:DNA-binding CsgD family transcriptional regulator
MKKIAEMTAILFITLMTFTGCGSIGDKTVSMSVIYGVTAVFALVLLIGYCCLIRKKDLWFMLLYLSVFIVNAGYFSLSISHNLAEALLANRISYFGSVFLPLSMLVIILNLCNFKVRRWFIGLLSVISTVIFFIAASPGYLDIYYKAVSLERVNGVTVLVKEYGEWHSLYLLYLMAFFAMMIMAIIHAAIKKKVSCVMNVVIPAVVVSVNIGVWLMEQLIRFDFEFLSVSYIISEIFLLSLYLMLQENEKQPETASSAAAEIAESRSEHAAEAPEQDAAKADIHENVTSADTPAEAKAPKADIDADFAEQCDYFNENLHTLTFTERAIFDLYLDGRATKEVLSELNIKENTLKYHNKNIYSKLGVSSRKQLLQIAAAVGSPLNKTN